MTREHFDALVARLEEISRSRPRLYSVQVGGLAVLGYAYVLGVLLLMLGLTAALAIMVISLPNGVTIKLGLIFGAIAVGISWAIIKALWVRLDPPQGIELTRSEVPALFKVLDELRERLKAPSFHKVVLDGTYNAAVVQVPRLGVFGWQKNYLLIGLPLLHGLSPDEFRVLAHELGHLSGNHARFGA